MNKDRKQHKSQLEKVTKLMNELPMVNHKPATKKKVVMVPIVPPPANVKYKTFFMQGAPQSNNF